MLSIDTSGNFLVDNISNLSYSIEKGVYMNKLRAGFEGDGFCNEGDGIA